MHCVLSPEGWIGASHNTQCYIIRYNKVFWLSNSCRKKFTLLGLLQGAELGRGRSEDGCDGQTGLA